MNKWINNNNFAKVLALAVSVLLWSMVHWNNDTPTPTAKIDTRIIENVKVQPFGLDEKKYILSAMDTDRVRIEIKGKKMDLLSAFSDEYKIKLDLTHAKVGTSTLPLSVDLPKGLELVNIQPASVTVNIEERNTATFPVTIVTKGTPAEGYILGKITPQPATVKVTLPESELREVAKVQGTISIDGEDSTMKEKRVKLAAYDKQGKEIEGAVLEPSSVTAEIVISPPYKEVPIELQYTGKLPDGLVISKAQPSVTKVKLYGPQDELSGVKSYSNISVDLSQITGAGTIVLPVDLTPPPGFEKIEPSSLQVEITTVSHSQRVIDAIPITIKKDNQSGLTADIINPSSKTMSLALTGAPGLLNSLTKDDIQLIASIDGLSPGVHDVTLQVILPRYISRADPGTPLTATVEIKDESTPTITHPNSGGDDKGQENNTGKPTNTETGGTGTQDSSTEQQNGSTNETGETDNNP
ncbi:CdaR family protein [Paenibacillus sp. VCA1]|uniref:CdaR family protein n=1 Tax=Paenibacillus sp. VCA1 TaxID=3039148 RepID=UPI0028720F34|nr:CdaR family protein [Paenibacillus sp. VCA1]MDR9856976.1 CdaR family protein [Paenibacillus sp. VCA1]